MPIKNKEQLNNKLYFYFLDILYKKKPINTNKRQTSSATVTSGLPSLSVNSE